jgi:hypothetical protein
MNLFTPTRYHMPPPHTQSYRIWQVRADMVGTDTLLRAFYEFDNVGKGYITEEDLQRVLANFGRRVET